MTSGTFINYITQYKGKADDATAAIHYIKRDILDKAFNTYAAGKVFYCHRHNGDRLFSYIYDMVFDKLVEMTPISWIKKICLKYIKTLF